MPPAGDAPATFAMVRVKDDAGVAGGRGMPVSIIFAHLPIDGKACGAVLEQGVSTWRASSGDQDEH